jgi:hypothetical protein
MGALIPEKTGVYIGVNDFNAAGGKTATMEQTLDGGLAAPVFSSVRLGKKNHHGPGWATGATCHAQWTAQSTPHLCVGFLQPAAFLQTPL